MPLEAKEVAEEEAGLTAVRRAQSAVLLGLQSPEVKVLMFFFILPTTQPVLAVLALIDVNLHLKSSSPQVLDRPKISGTSEHFDKLSLSSSVPERASPPKMTTDMATELVDFEWRFGVTASTSEVKQVGRTFVHLKLKLHEKAGEGRGKMTVKTIGKGKTTGARPLQVVRGRRGPPLGSVPCTRSRSLFRAIILTLAASPDLSLPRKRAVSAAFLQAHVGAGAGPKSARGHGSLTPPGAEREAWAAHCIQRRRVIYQFLVKVQAWTSLVDNQNNNIKSVRPRVVVFSFVYKNPPQNLMKGKREKSILSTSGASFLASLLPLGRPRPRLR